MAHTCGCDAVIGLYQANVILSWRLRVPFRRSPLLKTRGKNRDWERIYTVTRFNYTVIQFLFFVVLEKFTFIALCHSDSKTQI